MQSFRLSGSHYKTKENTFLSEINPDDIEILSFVDKPRDMENPVGLSSALAPIGYGRRRRICTAFRQFSH